MKPEDRLAWLLSGDVSIQYQVHRDLLGREKPNLRKRIAREGWGAALLARRHADGHWGRAFYQPKWTSSHYTMLDLKNLATDPTNKPIRLSLQKVLAELKGADGGINPSPTIAESDVCINGMFLNYASYFAMPQGELRSVVDFLLTEHMADGGFNCYSNRQGAMHSSLHSSLSVIEGIREYSENGYGYRLGELLAAESAAQAFILRHRLFRSLRTGEVIDKKMLMLSYPSRWRYDILRALDYFRSAQFAYDERMDDAVAVLLKKRRGDGRWPLQARHPGATHFEMETTGQPSRWNTLRALRVLRHFHIGE